MINTEKKEEEEEKKKEEEEVKFYREAFNNFDWNSSGTIPTKVRGGGGGGSGNCHTGLKGDSSHPEVMR